MKVFCIFNNFRHEDSTLINIFYRKEDAIKHIYDTYKIIRENLNLYIISEDDRYYWETISIEEWEIQ